MQVNYTYTEDKSIHLKGLSLSGYNTISRPRQWFITALCVFIFADEIYQTVNLGKLTVKNIAFTVITLAILVYAWCGPLLKERQVLKSFTERLVNINISPQKIAGTYADMPIDITAKNYRGYKCEGDFIVVYYDKGYILLYLGSVDETEQELTKEILNTFQSTADNTSEFPEFNADITVEKEEKQ